MQRKVFCAIVLDCGLVNNTSQGLLFESRRPHQEDFHLGVAPTLENFFHGSEAAVENSGLFVKGFYDPLSYPPVVPSPVFFSAKGGVRQGGN